MAGYARSFDSGITICVVSLYMYSNDIQVHDAIGDNLSNHHNHNKDKLN